MVGDRHCGFAAPGAVSAGKRNPLFHPGYWEFHRQCFPGLLIGLQPRPPQIAIIFGDGHGGFSAPRVIPIANDGTLVTGLVLLDANKDLKPDLVVNTASVTLHINESFLLLNDGTANFSVSHLSSIGGVLGGTAAFV